MLEFMPNVHTCTAASTDPDLRFSEMNCKPGTAVSLTIVQDTL